MLDKIYVCEALMKFTNVTNQFVLYFIAERICKSDRYNCYRKKQYREMDGGKSIKDVQTIIDIILSSIIIGF